MDQELLNLIASLRNEKLVKVLYFDPIAESVIAPWSVYSDSFHVLDFGLEIHTESGKVFSFSWEECLGGYKLSFYSKPIATLFSNYSSWEVIEFKLWSECISNSISNIKTYSSPSVDEEGFCLHTLELDFTSNYKIYIFSAQYIVERDVFLVMTDGVCVLFGEELAKKYGIGAFDANSSICL